MTTIRKFLGTVALLCGATVLLAQPIVAPVAPPTQPLQTPEQLEALVSPIALYPDPLVSIILPAATTLGDITYADQYLQQGGDPASVDAQPWDESVRAVAHYPELISWLDQNLPWTEQLGAAFLDQPADVMNTIQRLRQNARAAGILVDTPQQQVIVQQNYVYIEPAQPDVIYVPSYDPDIFYSSSRGYGRSAISFALSFSTGPWLSYEPDWGRRSIWIDPHRNGTRRDWRPPSRTELAVTAGRQQWHPSVDVSRRPRSAPPTTIRQNITNNIVNNTRPEVARPTPITRTRNYDARRAPFQNPANTTTFNPPPRPNMAPPPSPRSEPSRPEPVLTPTGRMSEPRVERDRGREQERAREPDHREAPAPAATPSFREREHQPAPAPQAAPPQSAPPMRLSTPPPQAKGPPPPPPQARPEDSHGKAKGHDRDRGDDKDDHDNDDRRKRGD